MPSLVLDRSVPGLIVKIGDYPLHHGGVGAIRSLGRLGVPVYAVTEDRFTPAAVSRYLTRGFVWRTSGLERPESLVDGLLRIGARIGRPSVLIPTDEEAAVLVAEHAGVLAETGRFLLPPVRAGLPRRLASKQGLHELCLRHGVPSPSAAFPDSPLEVAEFARTARFPVVAKNREAFERRRRPAVAGTTRITGPDQLLALARRWGQRPGVILQEYLPREQAEDWIVHAYVGADHRPRALFTGVKVRSWPPHAGMTACAYAVPNPELASLATGFFAGIGFCGIADLDLRFDRRDGRYKLLDFNPRMGAQFRLFENAAGVDVVRAMHLDLTDRRVPAAPQRDGRRMVVENIDLPALLAYRRGGYTTPHAPRRASDTEWAWLARDDVKPFLTMLARFAGPGVRHLRRLWRDRDPLAAGTVARTAARSTARTAARTTARTAARTAVRRPQDLPGGERG